MSNRMIDAPWGEVRLVSMPQPASEADFDLAPPWLRELVEPHFGEDHALWVEVTLLGLERVECCGEVLWRRDPDVPVELEGCDCINPAGGVEVMEHNGHVLITMEA